MSNDNLVMGLALLGGAILYSRRHPAAGKASSTPAAVKRGTFGTGSMPASVGSGTAQVLGGILGNLQAPQIGGGTMTGAPVTNLSMDQFPDLTGDNVIQNSTQAADPFGSFDPSIDGTLMNQAYA